MDRKPVHEQELPEGYEPPRAEDLDVTDGPAVTAAGLSSTIELQ